MKRTVLSVALRRRRVILPLFAALLAFIAAALVTFAASVAKAPEASDQTSTTKSFSVLCNWSHNSYDDPIVYPGKPSAAHWHGFVGNRTTEYNSAVPVCVTLLLQRILTVLRAFTPTTSPLTGSQT